MMGSGASCEVKTDGRQGSVTEVAGDRATVLLQPDAACGQGAGCAHCALFRPEAHAIQVPRDDLEPGDLVRIQVAKGDVYRSVIVVFILPPVLAIAGLAAGLQLGGAAGTWPAVAGFAAGLLIAIAIALLVNRVLARSSTLRVEKVRSAARR
jgi:positive regulator of sigma E activity